MTCSTMKRGHRHFDALFMCIWSDIGKEGIFFTLCLNVEQNSWFLYGHMMKATDMYYVTEMKWNICLPWWPVLHVCNVMQGWLCAQHIPAYQKHRTTFQRWWSTTLSTCEFASEVNGWALKHMTAILGNHWDTHF